LPRRTGRRSRRYDRGTRLNSFFLDPPTSPTAADSGTADGAGTAPFTDEELTALALAEEVDSPLDPDAVAFVPLSGKSALPAWYMPAAVVRSTARWHRPVIIAVIAAFLIVDAFGLCSTYG
jgi:hypothetical protein